MKMEPLADVEGVNLRPPIAQNPFGQLESGRIRLTGYVVQDTSLEWILNRSNSTNYGHRSNAVFCLTANPRVTFLMCNFDDKEDLRERERRWTRFTFYHKITGIHLIPLVQWEHPSNNTAGYIEDIMIAKSELEQDAFRRVGHFRSVDHILNDVGNEVNHLYFHMQVTSNIFLV
jgi:hypothetical protein